MFKKLIFSLFATIAFSSSAYAEPSPAQVIAIDFSTYTLGTAVPSVAGVAFSLIGGPGPIGDPVIGNYYGYGETGLTNSVNSKYPTASILNLSFSGLASNVSFRFDNYGGGYTATRGTSFFSAFDANGGLLETGFLGTGGTFSLLSSGIASIQLNNGTNGVENWLFGLNALNANVSTVVSPVPEPETYAMLLVGLGLLGFSMRRRDII